MGKKLNQFWANVHDMYNSKYNMCTGQSFL